MTLYERLAIEDIRNAADVLRPVFDATKGADGYVSLEVSPYLAMSTQATIAEARRLWGEVARDNVMIKVPATRAGLPAIRQLIADGINVNITLLFSQEVYEAGGRGVSGRPRAAGRAGRRPRKSRQRRQLLREPHRCRGRQAHRRAPAPGRRGEERAALAGIQGKVAIANAKLAYQSYKRLFAGARWEKLRAKGARVQRLLVGEHRHQEQELQRRALRR